MSLLVTIDHARGVVRLTQTNNIDTAMRNLKSRMKVDMGSIYQASSYKPTTIEMIHDILRPYRFIDNNRWSKEYMLDAYRVRVVLKLIGLNDVVTIKEYEYDILTCIHCNDPIEAQYKNITSIYKLISVVNGHTYCSDECEKYHSDYKISNCIVCYRKMKGNYLCCSAKCETIHKKQIKWNNEDTIKEEQKRAWEI